MHPVVIILGAGWVELIVTIVVIAFYVLSSLSSLMNKPAQAPRRPPQPRDPDAVPQAPRTLEEKLRSEVEEFLRQVQGEPPRPAKPTAPPAAPRPLVVKVAPPAVEPEVETPRVSIQEHVATNISTTDVTEHISALGAGAGLADERIQSHLHEKFEHSIGALKPRQTPVEKRRAPINPAAEIAALLRSPNGVRQVIIASEILRRPEI